MGEARLRRQRYRRLLEERAIWGRWGDVSGGLVLDYGCGNGWFLRRLARRGFKVIGLEVHKESLHWARLGTDGQRVLLVLYGGGVLPVKEESADLILAVGVIRSLMDRGPLEEAVKEWWRCLRKQGRLLLIETDNAALRRKRSVQGILEVLMGGGFQVLAWYPIRKTSWWGLSLIKAGLWPPSLYDWMAAWELRRRQKKGIFPRGKMAYLGEFLKP